MDLPVGPILAAPMTGADDEGYENCEKNQTAQNSRHDDRHCGTNKHTVSKSCALFNSKN